MHRYNRPIVYLFKRAVEKYNRPTTLVYNYLHDHMLIRLLNGIIFQIVLSYTTDRSLKAASGMTPEFCSETLYFTHDKAIKFIRFHRSSLVWRSVFTYVYCLLVLTLSAVSLLSVFSLRIYVFPVT